MAKLRLIKNLKNDNISGIQLLNNFVFGNIELEEYDPSRIYKYGDMIIRILGSNHVEVLRCQDDDVTGTYDPSLWEKSSIADVADGSKVLHFGEDEPTDRNTLLWLKTINTRTEFIPESFLEDSTDFSQ